MKIKLKGQSLSEYSICIAIVLIALVGINIYVKRGLQGRYKDAVNEVTAAVSAQEQYEPYYAESKNIVDMTRTQSRTISEMDKGKIINPGKVNRTLSSEPTTVESTNTEGVGAVGGELDKGSKVVKVQ